MPRQTITLTYSTSIVCLLIINFAFTNNSSEKSQDGDEDLLLVDDWGKTDNGEDDNQLIWEPNSKIGSRQTHSYTAASGRPKSLSNRETEVEDDATIAEQVVDIEDEDILWVGDYIEKHKLSREAAKGDAWFAQDGEVGDAKKSAVERFRPVAQVPR